MIKLTKDITSVPVSLIPAYADLFAPQNVPIRARTTHGRRMEVINNGSYIDHDNYNSRYKKRDIKEALNSIYNGKCAYCEQLVEQSHVEHYRPKSKYHWLAYSWDNLLLACGTCNQGKGVHFDIINAKVTFVNSEINVRNINNFLLQYDLAELPMMINPEVTDPFGLIEFHKNGIISSDDPRFAYTIEKCAIDRVYLNDQRRKLLNDFRSDIQSILVENAGDISNQLAEIRTLVKKFTRDQRNITNPYQAFRKFAIDNGWLNDIIKDQT